MGKHKAVAVSMFVLAIIALAQPAHSAPAAPARNYRAMGLAELKTYAEANVPEAQLELASRYDAGRGVAKDSIEATTWYRKAAEAGSNDATLALADRLIEGTAAEQKEALSLYRRLAEQGNADAMCDVGASYQHGRGTLAEPAQALAWYTKAADAGSAEGQLRVGECQRDGIGTAPNPAKAADFFKRAADKGNAEAAYALGELYRKGAGVEKNPREAVNQFSKAASRNHLEAQWALAQMYRSGEGVPADKDKALALLKKLVAARHPQALPALAQMSPDALKQLSKPLMFIGNVPDERLVGALVRCEGTMRSTGEGQWVLEGRGLGGRAVPIAVLPPPSAAPKAGESRHAATRPSARTPSPIQVSNAAKTGPDADATNWSRVKDGMPCTLWGTLTEKKDLQALMIKLTPPSIKFDYQLGDTAGVAAGRTNKYTIEGIIKNTGKTPLKNLKMKLRIYQESSSNEFTKEYTIPDTIPPGATMKFAIDAASYNDGRSSAVSKPKVEMEVLGYDW
jgi:TPR repeat protein